LEKLFQIDLIHMSDEESCPFGWQSPCWECGEFPYEVGMDPGDSIGSPNLDSDLERGDGYGNGQYSDISGDGEGVGINFPFQLVD
jgi:hypothetical protein